MEIYRNGLVFTLTDEELEQAYREQKRNYLLMDAEEQFKEYLRIHFDAIFVEDADAPFLQKYRKTKTGKVIWVRPYSKKGIADKKTDREFIL